MRTTLISIALAFALAGCTEREPPVSKFGEYLPTYTLASRYIGNDLYIAGTNGTQLAVDVLKPSGGDRLRRPVIVWPTVYNRATILQDGTRIPALSGAIPSKPVPGMDVVVAALLRHGYIVVVLDVTGFGASSGSPAGWLDSRKRQSIVDTIQWAAKQPWSNGKVGTTGLSWDAALALLPAVERPPEALKAIFARSPDLTVGTLPYGQLPNWQAGFLYGLQPASVGESEMVDAAPVNGNIDGLQKFMADRTSAQNQAELSANRASALVRARLETDEGRSGGGLVEYAPLARRLKNIAQSGVPTYVMGGAYDWLQVVEAPAQAAAFGIKASWHTGPHWQPEFPDGELRSLRADKIMAAEAVRWFDKWLKGIDTGIEKDPKVIGPMLDFSWAAPSEAKRTTAFFGGQSWPISNRSVTFYLGAQNNLSEALVKSSAQLKTIPMRFDASLALNGEGSTRTNGSGEKEWYGDLASSNRSNATLFVSPRLIDDLGIVGSPVITIPIRLYGQRGFIHVTLEEVDAQGRADYIAEGAATVTATKNASFENLKIQFSPVFNKFNKGHRIRVTINSFERSYFFLTSVLDGGIDPRGMVQMCYAGKACPASLVLPTVTRGYLLDK